MNKKNIIQILKSGSQELFYSSFISWLLDPAGEHGLNDRFSQWFFSRIGEGFNNFTVETEKSIKGALHSIYFLNLDTRWSAMLNSDIIPDQPSNPPGGDLLRI